LLVEDKLFATLDSVSRKLIMPSGKRAVLSDTVGFINKLPHELIAAFKSTLSEIKQAHLLLHVIDATDPHKEKQIWAVNSILSELDVGDKARINLYNKADLISGEGKEELNKKPDSLAISAKTAYGFDKLYNLIDQVMNREYRLIKLKIPYNQGGLRQKVFDRGIVISEESEDEDSILTVQMLPKQAARFAAYEVV
ncbi:MAG TPA: HflX family GTPase, partial [Actinobacteria bacterium]|nr:HflX family GTPase [Actinomycetes bacterium]HEX21170.1 HflX family GTPase [Actinomycetota bacterium]